MKSLNSMKCENVECGYQGSFDVKKQGWYWPVVIIGLIFFLPLWLFLLLHKNKAICPECSIESHQEPLIRKPKTGESGFFRFVVFLGLSFVAFLFYLAIFR